MEDDFDKVLENISKKNVRAALIWIIPFGILCLTLTVWIITNILQPYTQQKGD